MLNLVVTVAVRGLMVALFLPFSALDKWLNFTDAVAQAEQAVRRGRLATALILGGLCIEVVMSLAILTGIADRFAAFVLAGYCVVTALLWKQFWKIADFRLQGKSSGRALFWDFLKNFAVAGGFLLLAFGPDGSGLRRLVSDPWASSHPYQLHQLPRDSGS